MNYNLIFALFFLVSLKSFSSEIKLGIIYADSGRKSGPMCISEALINVYNKKGFKIKHFMFSNHSNLVGVANAATIAISDRLDVVIGTRTSQEAIAASNLFNKSNIPFVAAMASHPDVTKDKPYSTRMVSTSDRYSLLISNYMTKEFNPSKVAIVRNLSYPYSTFYSEQTAKNLKNINGKIEIKIFDIYENYSDFNSLVQSMLAWNMDMLYLPLYDVQINAILNALDGVKRKLRVLGNGGASGDRQLFYRFTKENPNITLSFHDIWTGKPRGRYVSEFNRLVNEYCPNFQSDFETAIAYDTAKMLLVTLEKSPKLRGLQLISSFKKIDFDGVTGRLFFDKSGSPIRDMPIISIKNGTDFKLDILGN